MRRSNKNDTTVYRWWVPLTYTSDISQPTKRQWLSADQSSRTLSNLGAKADNWIIFNVDQKSNESFLLAIK